MKLLYKGTFNWYGQIFTLYTHAVNKDRAFQNFITQISKKVGYNRYNVMGKFNGSVDNYNIQKGK